MKLFSFGILLALASMTFAQSVDPCFPGEWHARQDVTEKPMKRWLPSRIQQLELERDQLLARIDELPQHELKSLTDEFGFHSLPLHPDAEEDSGYHYLIADMVFSEQLNTISLVPAFYPADPLRRTYAFPKRFKIEILEGFGRWENGVWIPQESTTWVDVVNWMDEDFPDPGPYPVVFSEINLNASKVRISVPKSDTESASDYFALSELYFFRNQDGEIADNKSVFGTTGISFEASDSLAMMPVWDLQYAYDGVSVLGLPLSEEKTDVGDFIVQSGEDRLLDGPVQIVLDLGIIERIGRIEIWPTEAPGDMALPLFGFPEGVKAELSSERDFVESRVIVAEDARSRMHNDNLLTLICDGHYARYIRLTFDDFSEFMGDRILGLGEISVSEFGKVLSVGCDVSLVGISSDHVDQLPLLVDGFSRGRRILSESEWIIGLAKRRPLDARLALVEVKLVETREAWSRFLFRISVAGGCILLLILISAWVIQKRIRRRDLNNLKLQITRDLHDEVGSSLGSISLTSEQLEGMATGGDLEEELGELSLMAREASASLREVVWMTDQKTIRLPALIDKLVERVERVLRDVKVIVEVSPDRPDVEVSLMVKRHVIMFFKEAIHNCALHAKATQVAVNVSWNDGDLILSISDNGCGFDLSHKQDGWGLESMKKRAGEIGGKLDLESRLGEGTLVKLTIPLSCLSIDPVTAYRTSN